MNPMNDNTFRELKDAYVLGALPEDERAAVETYLALHSERQAEIEDLIGVAGLLALAPPEHDPPAGLRRRVLDAVQPEATPPRPSPTSSSSWFGRLAGLRNVALGAAAVLVVGLLSWNVLLQEDIRDLRGQVEEARAAGQAQEPREIRLDGTWAERGVEAQVTAIEEDRAIIVIEDMPPMPDDRAGQVWIIDDEVPQPSSLLEPSGDSAAAAITTPFGEADAIAVTIEPAGGSEEPTTEPVLVQEL